MKSVKMDESCVMMTSQEFEFELAHSVQRQHFQFTTTTTTGRRKNKQEATKRELLLSSFIRLLYKIQLLNITRYLRITHVFER